MNPRSKVYAPLRSAQSRRPLDVLRSTLRSGRRKADVHWTSCAQSSALKKEHQFSLQLILLFNLLVLSFFVSPFQTILPKLNLRFWWSVLLMIYFSVFFSLLFFSYCHYNTMNLFVNTFLKNIFKFSDILHIVLQTSNFSTFILLFYRYYFCKISRLIYIKSFV